VEKATKAFKRVKEVIAYEVLLWSPDRVKLVLVKVDASIEALGTVLKQAYGLGTLKPAAFLSKMSLKTKE
jgi:RNase H-like domain found in reverse transcriptase